jgi:hypothetical protein
MLFLVNCCRTKELEKRYIKKLQDRYESVGVRNNKKQVQRY